MLIRWRVFLLFVLIYIGEVAPEKRLAVNLTSPTALEGTSATSKVSGPSLVSVHTSTSGVQANLNDTSLSEENVKSHPPSLSLSTTPAVSILNAMAGNESHPHFPVLFQSTSEPPNEDVFMSLLEHVELTSREPLDSTNSTPLLLTGSTTVKNENTYAPNKGLVNSTIKKLNLTSHQMSSKQNTASNEATSRTDNEIEVTTIKNQSMSTTSAEDTPDTGTNSMLSEPNRGNSQATTLNASATRPGVTVPIYEIIGTTTTAISGAGSDITANVDTLETNANTNAIATPDIGTTNADISNSETSDSSTSESTSPESSMPESTTPESTSPETTSPESTTPESTTPESTTPESSTPESSTPESTTPETTSPDSSTSESTTSTTNVTTESTTSTTNMTTESTTATTSTTLTETTTTPPTTTLEITPPPTPPPPNTNAVEIVAGVLGVLLFAGLLATAAVMYRQGKLPWNPKHSNASVRPLPIALSKFENHCNELLDTQGRLGSEFQLLQALSVDISDTNTFTAAQLPDNKKKNRYTNILPYDATRVVLDVINDDPSSDYINASFVKGYTNTYEYIASQGPKEETISDFWRMVHQHEVQVIVMVTNFEEGGKPKCDHYLPKLRDQIYSGDMVVRCGTELQFPVYTQRTIVLHKGSTKRNIAHLHFNEWPDFGCPESTESMLQFCRTIRHQVSLYPPGIVLVHCSAGVGRTGTLIAVDILLQQIQESKKVDVFGTVFKLRKHRTNMVQTKGQYEYIYKCIRDAVKDPTFLKSDSSPSTSLEPIYENVPTTLTTFLYEKQK